MKTILETITKPIYSNHIINIPVTTKEKDSSNHYDNKKCVLQSSLHNILYPDENKDIFSYYTTNPLYKLKNLSKSEAENIYGSIVSYVETKYKDINIRKKLIEYKISLYLSTGKLSSVIDEFDSDHWDSYKIIELAKKLAESKNKIEPNTSIKCRKCHKKRIYAEEKQIRSADEASTTIYKCLYCGTTWFRN